MSKLDPITARLLGEFGPPTVVPPSGVRAFAGLLWLLADALAIATQFGETTGERPALFRASQVAC